MTPLPARRVAPRAAPGLGAGPGRWFGAALILALAGCGGRIVPPGAGTPAPPPRPAAARPAPPPIAAAPETPPLDRSAAHIAPALPPPLSEPPSGAIARATGVRPGVPVAALGILPAESEAALAAFRRSCPGLVRRADASGLTRGEDWRPACDAAARAGDAAVFFAHYFETVVIGDGRAFATGYYEPEIAAALQPGGAYQTPIYRRPADLVEVDLGAFAADLKGRKLRGQVRDGRLVPYPDRAAIEAGALAGQGLEIAWAADGIEFFFLQIQGSGRLRLPDGRVLRIGYDTQNGRDYVGIGSLLKRQGIMPPGGLSMQGVMDYLRGQPDGGKALMDANRSFVFFRPLAGGGPVGAMGVTVAGGTSVAADPAFVPLGAPIFTSVDRPEASGLWIAQDTGGAIKGPNRIDTFWGAGAEARRIAGGMSARGTAWLLLPVGTLARLNASAPPPPDAADAIAPPGR